MRDQIEALEEWGASNGIDSASHATRGAMPGPFGGVWLPPSKEPLASQSGEDATCPMQAGVSEAQLHTEPSDIAALLDARLIDVSNPPQRPVPIYKLSDHNICTPGNLTGLNSQAKAGKTAVVGAMVASALSCSPDIDTFTFSSSPERGGAIIHFDCEQSDFDVYQVVERILCRAALKDKPARLRTYTLAGVSVESRRRALGYEMKRAAETFGGVHSVFIDGVADLCFDPNDSAEAFDLIEELQHLAIGSNTAMVLVLHENPGGAFGKTRGHLGSQLERKAESNLRLVKDEAGITEIFGEKCRHAHVPKGKGPRFRFDPASGMHTSCESTETEKRGRESQDIESLAHQIFGRGTSQKYGQLKKAIMDIRGVKEKAAERWLGKLTSAGVILKNDMGLYTKSL